MSDIKEDIKKEGKDLLSMLAEDFATDIPNAIATHVEAIVQIGADLTSEIGKMKSAQLQGKVDKVEEHIENIKHLKLQVSQETDLMLQDLMSFAVSRELPKIVGNIMAFVLTKVTL